jgi:hypothetical protein
VVLGFDGSRNGLGFASFSYFPPLVFISYQDTCKLNLQE